MCVCGDCPLTHEARVGPTDCMALPGDVFLPYQVDFPAFSPQLVELDCGSVLKKRRHKMKKHKRKKRRRRDRYKVKR